MTKEEFISTLKSENPSKETKIEVCQYFIDNYPVKVKVGMNPFTGETFYDWTALQGYTIVGGSDEKVNQAYDSLKSRIKQLEEFN